jgi:hypothetical protein
MRDEDDLAARHAGNAVTLARSAGATFMVAAALLGWGGWKARLDDCSDQEVFAPLLESLDLWERLRIGWGRLLVTEEIAQALAIRGHGEEAFVLWGAVDASGLQAPAKIGRARRTGSYVSDISLPQQAAWHSQGSAMTLDQAVGYARRALVAVIA